MWNHSVYSVPSAVNFPPFPRYALALHEARPKVAARPDGC